MALGEIKHVGIEMTVKGAKDYASSMREVKAATKEAYSELKLAQSQYDKNTSVTKKLEDRQKYLATATEEYKKKLEILNAQLSDMENAENRDEAAISKKKAEINECKAKINEYEKALKDVNNQLTTHSAQLKEWGEKLKKVGDGITSVGKNLSTKVTAPLVGVGAIGVKKFAEVDKTMQLTNKTMGNTEEEAKMLNQAMKDAAANSTFGMTDAATATLNFARAGLNAEQASSALAPAMNLAAGEGGNLDTVSAGLVATINGFHGSFDDAGKYADVFAAACNNSALDVDSLSNAMSVAAPIFSSAGYSVNDAALYMGVMANSGIEANKAANSLKTGMARLVAPAKDGAEMMKKLGISVTNSDGTMKDSVQVQQELHDAFSNLSESEQIAAASAIFGKNQMAPWLALINTAPADVQGLNNDLSGASMTIDSFSKALGENGLSLDDIKARLAQLGISGEAVDAMFQTSNGDAGLFAEGLLECANSGVTMDDVIGALGGSLDTVQQSMNNTKGTTDEMAESMMSGFGGSLEKLKSSIDVAATSLGEALAPSVQKVSDFIQDLVDKFNALDPEQQQTIATIGAVVAAIGPLLVIIGTVISSIGSIISGIGAVSGAIGTLTGGAGIAALIPAIGGVVAAAAPLLIGGLIIAGIVAGAILIVKHWDEIKAGAKDLKDKVVKKWDDFWKKTDETVEKMTDKWEGFKNDTAQKFDDFATNAKNGFDSARASAEEKLGQAYETVKGTMQSIVGEADFNWSLPEVGTTPLETAQNFAEWAFDGIMGFVDFTWGLPDVDTGLVGDAVEWVQNAIDGVKDVMDFDWSFPHIDLPHFSWSWNDLGIVSIPSISVDWYAKAYNQPYMFSTDTVVGTGSGLKGFGDGNGSEIVYGHEALLQDIRTASGSEESIRALRAILKVLNENLPALANMNITLDGRTLVGQLAPAMDAQMGIISARKERGN